MTEGTPALEPLRKSVRVGRKNCLAETPGADRRGLSDDVLRLRWTKSGFTGDCSTWNSLCVFDLIKHTETQ
jgi:hypothetical protein